MTISELFKKWGKWAILLGIVLVGGICGLRSCDLYQSRGVLLGEITQLKATAKLVAAKSDKIIADNKKVIAAQNVQISLLTTQIGHANTIIGGLQASYGDLEKQYAASNTCAAKLSISLAQIVNLKGQIAEKDKIIGSQDNVIIAWQNKYNLQVGISGAWEAKYNAENALRLKDDDLIKSLGNSLRLCRLTGGVKTGLVIAAIGYIGAKALGVIK